MDTHVWMIILGNMIAFETGVLFGRDIQIPLLVCYTIYFTVTVVVYMIGYYILDIKP